MFHDQLAAAIDGARPRELDHLARLIWQSHSAGALEDAEAQMLAEALQARRTQPQMRKSCGAETFARGAHPAQNAQRRTFFARAPYQRSPDRERSIQRRRTLAATWPLPPFMCSRLTTSQVAYARIVADEVARSGDCRLSLDEIAARGGMCRKTAKRAQERLSRGNVREEVEGLGWIAVELRPVDGQKHLTNVITITSAEWMTWIKRGPGPSRLGGQKRPATANPFSSRGANRTIQPEERLAGAINGDVQGDFAPKLAAGSLKRETL